VKVSIDACNIIDDDISSGIISSMNAHSQLESLYWSSHLSSSGSQAIEQVLLNVKPVLRKLSLDWCCSDQSMRLLSNGLKHNETLQELSITAPRITWRGFRMMSSVLKQTGSLDKLYLSNCNICDRGSVALAEGLSCNGRLTALSIPRVTVTEN
jgi:hypothetical protein